MDPRNIRIHDYSYFLPEEKIARYPVATRDSSKLLIYKAGNIQEDVYKNIASHLPENAHIIFNDTKVIEARLHFQKPTGGVIEIFCLEPSDQYPDITTAMTQHSTVLWNCLIGGASKWKHGMILEKKLKTLGNEVILTARIHAREKDTFIIEFNWTPPTFAFAEVLHMAGAIPLPPYIKREAEPDDAERYQTIYARESGSVAAPTAGLHFSPAIFSELESKRIKTDFITLHVGAGTFKPVKSETMDAHEMHPEFFEVGIEFIQSLLSSRERIAIGTTTARTLESIYWLGVKTIQDPEIDLQQLHLEQWEAYDLPQNISVEDAITHLLDWMKKNQLDSLITKTKLLIAPGYQIRIFNILVTNFHQPESTLLLLVAAVAGKDWRKIYDHALQHEYRFLSYGDGCLIYVE
jgi:S-adenosylmethionine:tRNA ribosyltransferase-isomerase